MQHPRFFLFFDDVLITLRSVATPSPVKKIYIYIKRSKKLFTALSTSLVLEFIILALTLICTKHFVYQTEASRIKPNIEGS